MNPNEHQDMLLAAALAGRPQADPRRTALAATIGNELGDDGDPLERFALEQAMAERDRDFAANLRREDQNFELTRDKSRRDHDLELFRRNATREDLNRLQSRTWTKEDWTREVKQREQEATTGFNRSEDVRRDTTARDEKLAARRDALALMGEISQREAEGLPVPDEMRQMFEALSQTAGMPASVRRQAAGAVFAGGDPEGARRMLSGQMTEEQEIAKAAEREQLLNEAAKELDSGRGFLGMGGGAKPWGESTNPFSGDYWKTGFDPASVERARVLQQRNPKYQEHKLSPAEIARRYFESVD